MSYHQRSHLLVQMAKKCKPECESQGDSNTREASADLQDSLVTEIEPESHSADTSREEYDKGNIFKTL